MSENATMTTSDQAEMDRLSDIGESIDQLGASVLRVKMNQVVEGQDAIEELEARYARLRDAYETYRDEEQIRGAHRGSHTAQYLKKSRETGKALMEATQLRMRGAIEGAKQRMSSASNASAAWNETRARVEDTVNATVARLKTHAPKYNRTVKTSSAEHTDQKTS